MTRKQTLVRLVLPTAWFVVGCALAGAAYAGNMVGVSHALEIGTVVGAAVIVVVGRGSTDLGAVLRAERDERQSLLDVRARGVAALVVFVVCAAQTGRWYANGHSQLAQPYLVVCIVEAIAYIASLLWLSIKQQATTNNAVT
jgi:hypothetical protein